MMFIYSGQVRECEVGLPTPFVDAREQPVFTGDIVAMYWEDSDGVWKTDIIDHFTVALASNFHCYVGQRPVRKDEPETPFIMGYKSMIPRKEPESEETALVDKRGGGMPDGICHIVKVKSFEDVVSGEHWKEFGFNYREEPE